MADTARRFAGPVYLGVAASVLYTVPGSTTAILRYIRVTNSNAADRTITLSIGADGAGKRLIEAQTVPGNGALDWSGFVPLNAAETLQGLASAATSLTVTLAGVEVT
jgi:hypothetical protein